MATAARIPLSASFGTIGAKPSGYSSAMKAVVISPETKRGWSITAWQKGRLWPIPSTSTDFYPGANTPQYPYDKAKAAALLDEAGYKPGAGGTRFSLKLLPAPWGEDISLWSTFIQQSLGEIGIPVEIVRNDGGGFLKQVYGEHAFDLATGALVESGLDCPDRLGDPSLALAPIEERAEESSSSSAAGADAATAGRWGPCGCGPRR